MAKKKAAQHRPQPPTSEAWVAMIPQIREHFRLEIETLLAEVPAELWEDPELCGVLYEFLPWHQYSSISIQLRDDDPTDIGGWTHYECAEPDGRAVTEEFEMYAKATHGLVYHRLLIEAAAAMLEIDFSPYTERETIEEGTLNRLFQLQVYHADAKFKFNYCEYVLARRLE